MSESIRDDTDYTHVGIKYLLGAVGLWELVLPSAGAPLATSGAQLTSEAGLIKASREVDFHFGPQTDPAGTNQRR